jgi:hypothetical protein
MISGMLSSLTSEELDKILQGMRDTGRLDPQWWRM